MLLIDSLLVGSLPGESCDTRRPAFVPRGFVSFLASDNKLGIMMSSFNQRRSKMDGTGAWHLSEFVIIGGIPCQRLIHLSNEWGGHIPQKESAHFLSSDLSFSPQAKVVPYRSYMYCLLCSLSLRLCIL